MKPTLERHLGRLQLISGNKKIKPLSVDFCGGSLAHKRRFGKLGKNQLIGKAIGLKNKPNYILDLTAGLGTDSFIFLCLGCKVVSLERSQEVYALLEDGYQRALEDPETRDLIAGRWSLVPMEAMEYLEQGEWEEAPDVIYLDPMFPEKKKSALPSAEMQLMQELLGAGSEPEEEKALLMRARQLARQRVVVKRPIKSSPIAEEVNFQFTGRSIRYDMYLGT